MTSRGELRSVCNDFVSLQRSRHVGATQTHVVRLHVGQLLRVISWPEATAWPLQMLCVVHAHGGQHCSPENG